MGKINDLFTIRHNDTPAAQGSVLIAEPFMKGSCFERSVVLLAQHDERASMGFVLNKPRHLTLNEFFPKVKFPFTIPIYIGGPVQILRLFFIHRLGEIVPDTIKLSTGMYLGGDLSFMLHYLRSSQEQPIPFVKFFVGYSGWLSGQLQGEIDDDDWIVSNLRPHSIMMAENDSFWNDTLSAMGGKYRHWANYPRSPRLN